MNATPARGAPPRRRLGVRLVLTALVVVVALLTAALVHSTWSVTANRNVRDVVGQLNRQIVSAIGEELTGVLANASAVQEALRTIFFQNVISTTDEAKREFTFLALLQSQPSLSWISFGWPDGHFFGAQKVDDRQIRMVEVGFDKATGVVRRRVDNYDVIDGDIEFKERLFTDSAYDSTRQPWYVNAATSDIPVWSEVMDFPTKVRPAISTSTRLVVFQDYIGVINVVIELERLSRFLTTLKVGQNGTVFILAPDGRVMAAPLDPKAHPMPESEAVPWRRLGTDPQPELRVAAAALKGAGMTLGTVAETRQLEADDPADGRPYFVTFSPLNFQGWTVATVIPTSDFLDAFDRSTRMLLWAVAVFVIAIAVAGTLLVDRLVVGPIQRIAKQLRHVEQFRLDRITHIASPLREIDSLSTTLDQMGRGLASFQKFLPTELVRLLVSQGVEARPGGSRQTLTILFTDLAGFTTLSERLGDRIVPVLADYLGRMSRIVQDGGGTVDKFIGDAVMAFWGAPLPDETHAVDACRVALKAQSMLAEFRRSAEHDGAGELRMRLGVNTGEVLVGNIGSEDRLNYTAIGDPVNVASRLESLNKRYGTEILIGEDTRLAAGEAIVVRRVDTVAVYGRMHGIAIYELLAMAEDGPACGALDWVGAYEAGLAAYRDRRWDRATELFRETIRLRGGADGPAAVMIGRCAEFGAEPPAADWMGVSVMETK
jgi:adenylate cyclase